MKYNNESIRDAIIKGLRKSKSKIEQWTYGSFYPWDAPESIHTVYVAESIGNLEFTPGVFCEYSAGDTKKETGAHRGRFPSTLGYKQRPDIIVTTQKDSIKTIIEIKKHVWTKNQIVTDLKKIRDIWGNGTSTINRSYITYFRGCEKKAIKTVLKFITELLPENSSKILNEKGGKFETKGIMAFQNKYTNKDFYFFIGILEISRKN